MSLLFTEGNCKSVFGLESNCEDAPLASHTIWDSWYSPSRNMDVNATFYSTLLYLIITAVTVLLFTLGYYFIEVKFSNIEFSLLNYLIMNCIDLFNTIVRFSSKILKSEDSLLFEEY